VLILSFHHTDSLRVMAVLLVLVVLLPKTTSVFPTRVATTTIIITVMAVAAAAAAATTMDHDHPLYHTIYYGEGSGDGRKASISISSVR